MPLKLRPEEELFLQRMETMTATGEGCALCVAGCYLKALTELIRQGDVSAYAQMFKNGAVTQFSDSCAYKIGPYVDEYLGM